MALIKVRRRVRTGAARRIGWGLADQALSSLTNFALGILAARSLGARDFGAFSLAFAVYVIILGTTRALTSEPLVVRYSHTRDLLWRRAVGDATGTALVVAGAGGGVLLAFGILAGPPLGPALIALGITVPGLMVQDTYRISFFAVERGRSAFANDLVWALALGAALIWLFSVGDPTLVDFMLAWGLSATVAAVFGVVQGRVFPQPRRVRSWWTEHRELAPRFAGEFAAGSGATQISVFGIVTVGSLTAAGILRAGGILMGPLNVLFMGINLVAIPEGVKALRESARELVKRSLMVSMVLSLSALGWGLFLLLLPQRIGDSLLGSVWDQTRTVIFPLAVSMCGLGIVTGATVGLRALAAARRSLRARVVTAPLLIVGPVAGVAIAGAPGAAWGGAITSLAGGVVWWLEFVRGLDDRVAGRDGGNGERSYADETPPEPDEGALLDAVALHGQDGYGAARSSRTANAGPRLSYTDRLKDAAYRTVKRHSVLRSLAVRVLNAVRRTLMTIRSFPVLGRSADPPSHIVRSTAEWVNSVQLVPGSRGAAYETIRPPRVINRPPPKALDKEIHWRFKSDLTYDAPTNFVAVIPGGRVWGEGQIVSPDNGLLADVSLEFRPDGGYISSPEEHPLLAAERLPRPTSLTGTVAVMSAPGGRGYYHWLCDVLPRFELIRESTLLDGPPDRYIVNSSVTEFQRESLDALGIDRATVIESMWHPHLTAENLVLPSLADRPGYISDWAVDFLRETFSRDAPPSSAPKRIYISRGHATHRKLANEDDLFVRLRERGFEKVEMESLSLHEKAGLLGSAEVVLGPHGAGLTNAVFCSPGCKVLELFSPLAVNPVYWRLSCAAGLDYYYVIGMGDVPPKGVDPQAGTADIVVDPDKVVDTLRLAGVT